LSLMLLRLIEKLKDLSETILDSSRYVQKTDAPVFPLYPSDNCMINKERLLLVRKAEVKSHPRSD